MTAPGDPSGRPRRRVALAAFTPTSLSGAELTERTVGREDPIERIVGFLRTAATSRDRPHVLVVGPRGSGKTHLLAVVLHRARQVADVERRLAFACVPEDAFGISSYEDLLVAAVEHLLDGAPRAAASKQETLDEARRHRGARDPLALEQLVRALLDGRVLVLVLENLDRIFALLGETGQARLRGFTETTGELLVLASTPLLFDAVSRRDRPWFGSFAVEHLDELSVEDGGALLGRIAREDGDDALAQFLTTDAALARLRAVAHLAGGSPRMWMILAGCMTVELVDELVPLVETMLDQLAPYYQQRLWELPPIEQKLVAELCRTTTLSREGRIVHEQRGMRTVADLATVCGIDQRVAATALGRLLEARWVRRSKPAGTDRRTTWYEVREPLLRHYLQYRETRGEPLRVIVGFLRAWYEPHERLARLAGARPGSLAERYLSWTTFPEFGESDALYRDGAPERLIAGARCLLDDEPGEAWRGVRGPTAPIVAEAVGLDVWRGREQALDASRSRLRALERARRGAVADVLAAALPAGERVPEAELLPPGAVPAATTGETPTAGQRRIASALMAAVRVADDRLSLRERIELRLLTGGWIGVCGDPARACELLEQTAALTGGLAAEDAGLRLSLDSELALCLFWAGRREEGQGASERVLAERLAMLGPDHPDTLTSRGSVAWFVGEAGDPLTARDLCAQLAVDRARVLGPEHPATLWSRYAHALFAGAADEPLAARDLLAGVGADCARVLGADHPATLMSRYAHAHYVVLAEDPGAAASTAPAGSEPAHREHDAVKPSIRTSRSMFMWLPGWGAAAPIALVGDDPRLRMAAEAVLRIDSALAAELLAVWCRRPCPVDAPSRAGFAARVVQIATGAGRATQLGAALLRALAAQPDADRMRWTSAWLAAVEGREELAVAHRMLRAASVAIEGDPTAVLALPAEEQRVVEAVLRRDRDTAPA